MKKFYIFFLISFLTTVSAETSSGISTAQQALLDNLPPDQRESVHQKMRQAEDLESELEETFEEIITISERPEEKILTEQERIEYEKKYRNNIFGYEQFQTSPTTFAPASKTPIPSNYVLGPGDKVKLQYYGNENNISEGYISRSGSVNLPKLGPVTLSGLTVSEAEKTLQKKVSSELIGTEVHLSISDLRSISVYILGEAYTPGSYTVSSLSTLTNLLFVSGGVNERGSVRNIEVKRDGKTETIYDFYKLLLKGDTSSDARLQDGDIIFIPLFNKTARAEGSFRRPGLFEMKENETIKDLLYYAGGFSSKSGENAKLELSSIINSERMVSTSFSSDKDFLSKEIVDGDSLKVFELTSLEEGTVTLSGKVRLPGPYTIQQGDTILDVINRAGGLTEDAYIEGAVFTREEVARQQKISFERTADFLEQSIADAISTGNIENFEGDALKPISILISRIRNINPVGRLIVDVDPLFLERDPQSNLQVMEGDKLFIPSRPSSINVVGEVYSPSSHSYKSDSSIRDYIRRSGGLRNTAQSSSIFIISPNGESIALQRRMLNSETNLLPGSTIVIPRDPRPFDWIVMTKTLTPILANLATSVAAIAALD